MQCHLKYFFYIFFSWNKYLFFCLLDFLLLILIIIFFFISFHYFLSGVNFFPAIAIAFPFLVLALHLVLCPRTGNFFLCLEPLYEAKSINLLIFKDVSLRKSPSTVKFWSIYSLIFKICSSVNSLTLFDLGIFRAVQICCENYFQYHKYKLSLLRQSYLLEYLHLLYEP